MRAKEEKARADAAEEKAQAAAAQQCTQDATTIASSDELQRLKEQLRTAHAVAREAKTQAKRAEQAAAATKEDAERQL